jgi:hypothetical protein
MMAAVLARGAAIAERAQDEAVARVASAAEAALPDVVVTTDSDGVTLAGRGLTQRLADEPQLRWIGSLVR